MAMTRIRRDDAEAFLRDLLGKGPVAAKEVKEAAGAKGLAWRTVERAKKSVGVVVTRSGFGASGGFKWSIGRQMAVNDKPQENRILQHRPPSASKVAVNDKPAATEEVINGRILAALKAAERPLYADEVAKAAGIYEKRVGAFQLHLMIMSRNGLIKRVGSLVIHPDLPDDMLLDENAPWRRPKTWRQISRDTTAPQ